MNIETLSALMQRVHTIHFIGIGGVSMSSLAAIAKGMGFEVTGSDRSVSEATERLCAQGITVYRVHDGENVKGADAVVYTAAIPASNPEMVRAEQDGIPLITRGQFLGWLMKSYKIRVGAAGTHGKSTTTSLLAEIWMSADVDPTIVSGAALDDLGGAYRVGKGDGFLFEACEYKDSFLSFFPTTAIVSNVEWDHTDYFHTFDRMKQSFLAYMNLSSLAVVCGDDPEAREVAGKTSARVVFYGIESPDAKYRAENVVMDTAGASFDLVVDGERLTRLYMLVTGRHNVLDALAAAAASMENGIGIEAVRAGIERFRGAKRRFELRGEVNGAQVFDDYAHHPSEIRATLEAAALGGKKVLCVFQPHTYSRTAELFDGFADALSGADRVLLADIYAARETNTYGVSSAQLAQRIPGAEALGSFEEIADKVREEADENTIVLVMGAGDIIKVSDLLFPDGK